MATNSIDTPDWTALPAPLDDGAARHLQGMPIASVPLPATDRTVVNLSTLSGWTLVYTYPRTGRPGEPNPDGWDLIPGARGCTPQNCSFRDHFAELNALGVAHVFGLSAQDTNYQHEVAKRLHLPFPLLSDQHFRLVAAMRLPTFDTAGMKLLKRLALAIRGGVIQHTFYPVFPPDRNAAEVVAWFKNLGNL
jgi:peroxiredoxin